MRNVKQKTDVNTNKPEPIDEFVGTRGNYLCCSRLHNYRSSCIFCRNTNQTTTLELTYVTQILTTSMALQARLDPGE